MQGSPQPPSSYLSGLLGLSVRERGKAGLEPRWLLRAPCPPDPPTELCLAPGEGAWVHPPMHPPILHPPLPALVSACRGPCPSPRGAGGAPSSRGWAARGPPAPPFYPAPHRLLRCPPPRRFLLLALAGMFSWCLIKQGQSIRVGRGPQPLAPPCTHGCSGQAPPAPTGAVLTPASPHLHPAVPKPGSSQHQGALPVLSPSTPLSSATFRKI